MSLTRCRCPLCLPGACNAKKTGWFLTAGVPTFDEFLRHKQLALNKGPIEILQLNIGLYCNQACNHCHVESSPKRTEMMPEHVAQRCMQLMERTPSISTLDLTGGAPELNSQFRYLVTEVKIGIIEPQLLVYCLQLLRTVTHMPACEHERAEA